LRDVHGFRGERFGLDAEQTRQVFPEDQIQLIGIQARVFDDLADFETERHPWSKSRKSWRFFYSHQLATRSASGNLHFGQKFVQVGNSILSRLQPCPCICDGLRAQLSALTNRTTKNDEITPLPEFVHRLRYQLEFAVFTLILSTKSTTSLLPVPQADWGCLTRKNFPFLRWKFNHSKATNQIELQKVADAIVSAFKKGKYQA
jgi:hypothetical protein